MSERSKSIKSWDKGNITVGTLRNTFYAVSNTCQFQDKVSSVIDLSNEATTINNKPIPPNAVIDRINTDRPVEYDWTNDINDFNNYVYWIWGGVTSGGVGLCKSYVFPYLCFVVSHGYYINYNTGNGRYYIQLVCYMNYANMVYDLSQVAFAYVNRSARSASYINPFPADDYLNSICILIKNGTPSNTTNENPWVFWRLMNDGSRVNPWYYDPEPNNVNSYGTADLNAVFGDSWTYDESIPRNVKRYLPDLCFTVSGTSVASNVSCQFLDDENYGGKKLFRTYVGPRYQGGFSDHLPVYIDLRSAF